MKVLAEVSRIRQVNIVQGLIPANAFYTSADSVVFSEGNNERARDVLIRAFEDQNGLRRKLGLALGYSWSLNYEANENTFFFNCIVRSSPASVTGQGNSSRLP